MGPHWSYLGYNMSMHDSCERFPGGTEALGRFYVRGMRQAVECLNALDTPARRRDAARFLSFFQPGGVPIANGDSSGPPLRFRCPDRATASREYAEAYAPLRTSGCSHPEFPYISVVRDSRMVTEGTDAERERNIITGLAHETAHLLGYGHDGTGINLPYLMESCCFLAEPQQLACEMLKRNASPGTIRTGREMAAIYRSVNRVYYGFYEFWPKHRVSARGLIGYALGVGEHFAPPMEPLRRQQGNQRPRGRRGRGAAPPTAPTPPAALDPWLYISSVFAEAAFQALDSGRSIMERTRVSLESEYETRIRGVIAPMAGADSPSLRRYLVLWGTVISSWAREDEAGIESALANIEQLRATVCPAIASRTSIDSLNESWALVIRTIQDEERNAGPPGRPLRGIMDHWESITQFCVSQSTSR